MVFCLTSINVIAAEGAYQMFSCPTNEAANSCSNLCKKHERTIDFKVNVQKSIVIQNFFNNGDMIGSAALENCKVVDSNNWYCESESSIPQFSYIHYVQHLTNGIYVTSTFGYYPANKNDPKYLTNLCAKKKSLFGIFD